MAQNAEADVSSKKIPIKLSVWGLMGVVVSSVIGSGVYSLPQNMAVGASAGSIIAAWIITGIGMFCIVYTFHLLSKIKPQTTGIYSYAQEGFGMSSGFFIAWGYWLCNICANTGLAVILMESLNYFFPPYFAGGNNLNSLIVSTLIIWVFYILVYRGIKTATMVNFIGTCFKLVPVFIFIALCLFAFKFDILRQDLFDNFTFANFSWPVLFEEIKSTMLVTIWAFIGVETAVVLSGRAKKTVDISKATRRGFFFCLACYILISVLPLGILPREAISAFPNPSTAGVLEHILGKAGGLIMIAGLMVSVLFSWLSWVIIATEVPYSAALKGTYPKVFTKENKKGVPVFSLLITTITTQITLLIAFFSADAWNTMLSITGVMILPVYLVTTLYLFKVSSKKGFTKTCNVSKAKALFIGSIGVLYSLWLIYAANIQYLVTAVLFFAAGIPVLIMAKKQKQQNEQNNL